MKDLVAGLNAKFKFTYTVEIPRFGNSQDWRDSDIWQIRSRQGSTALTALGAGFEIWLSRGFHPRIWYRKKH